MNYRTIEKAGAKVSLLGFGCMRLPLLDPDDPATIDMEQSQRMVDLAIQSGVNYFDTAYMYHKQHSELAMGQLLANYPRGSYYLADKFPLSVCEKLEGMDKIFEEQLSRCRTDYFDFYLLHGIQRVRFENLKTSGIYERALEYKKQGRIKNLGCSFHDTPEVLREVLDRFAFDFVQIQLNYLDWDLIDAKACYELLEERGIPAIVMEPVRGGFLANLPEKHVGPFYKADPNASQASWALRWVAGHPGVKVILSGMSNLQQLQDNLKTLGEYRPLDETERQAVAQVQKNLLGSLAVPCTGCNYCMPCPFGVNIPSCFNFFNRYHLTGMPQEFSLRYPMLAASGQDASHCRSCGRCVRECPQHIDIPAMLQEVQAKAEEFRS